MYEKINGEINSSSVHVVDLRSDTISKPTPEMREAMAVADVGDDVFGEDPTVAELERRSAELLGKEDALFVASGTMANLIAIMVHCSNRGSEIISGHNGHTFRFEQGGPAQIAGVQTSLIKNEEDGTFSLDELRDRIRKNPDVHEPYTDLVIIENTHNMCGGKVLPLDWIEKVKNISKEHNIPVHMDGARVFNAAVYLKVPVERVVRDVDTVCFCLSKGLGAPIGSILAGSKSFINKARRTRKVLGGGWRQAGIIAAAGLVALDKMVNRLQEDHDHIMQIAKAIDSLKSDLFKVDLSSVQTNILMMYIDPNVVAVKEVIYRLAKVFKTDIVKVSVRASSIRPDCIRFVTYWQITDDDVRDTIDRITFVINEFETIHKLNSKIFRVDISTVQTNILMMYLDANLVTAREVLPRLASVKETDEVKVSLKATSRDPSVIRFTTYWEITDEDVQAAIKKIQFVIREFENQLKN